MKKLTTEELVLLMGSLQRTIERGDLWEFKKDLCYILNTYRRDFSALRTTLVICKAYRENEIVGPSIEAIKDRCEEMLGRKLF